MKETPWYAFTMNGKLIDNDLNLHELRGRLHGYTYRLSKHRYKTPTAPKRS